MTARKPEVTQHIDELTPQELDARAAQTQAHIQAIRGLWPGLVRYSASERRGSLGRSLGVLAGPLQMLFAVLTPATGSPALAQAFNVLGAQDQGTDPERFEAELLARRLYRVQTEQKVSDALTEVARHFGDDVLATGELVVGPGLLALELARSVAKARPEFASLLAPVLDAFRELTRRARKHLDDARSHKTETTTR